MDSKGRGIKDRYIKKHKPESMLRQGLPGLTAAKVQQKNELTKYFGKKVQILYKKRYNRRQVRICKTLTTC